jgi:hypothetical protein
MRIRPFERPLILAAFAVCVALASPACNQEQTKLITPSLEAGCALVSLVDKSGSGVASYCEKYAPVLGPFITDLINKLESGQAVAGQAAPVHYTAITKDGKQIGQARDDIAAAVQAKVNSL